MTEIRKETISEQELRKRGGVQSVLSILNKKSKASVQETILLILSNCTYENPEICVKTVELKGIPILSNCFIEIVKLDGINSPMIQPILSIFANCASSDEIQVLDLAKDFVEGDLIATIAEIVIQSTHLPVINEACLIIGNLACASTDIRSIIGKQPGFFEKLLKLIKELPHQHVDSVDDEFVLENVSQTLANCTESLPENVKCLDKLDGIPILLELLKELSPLCHDEVSQADVSFVAAAESISTAIMHCVQQSTVACQSIVNMPNESGTFLFISLLVADVVNLQRTAVAILSEITNIGTDTAIRDKTCNILRDPSSGALQPLSWMSDHSLHSIQVDAKRCLTALQKYGTERRNALRAFVEQGCIPVLHQLTVSENQNTAEFASRFLDWCVEQLDLEFIDELVLDIQGGTTGKSDAEICGNISTAIVHLCFGARVEVRQHFVAAGKGLDKITEMLSSPEHRGPALDFFFAIESILPSADDVLDDEDTIEQIEEARRQLAEVVIDGKPVSESIFNSNSSHADLSFNLGPKRQPLWAHRAVILANGSKFLKSMIGRKSKEVAIDPPKSIAQEVGQEEYYAAFECIVWYTYFPDADNSFFLEKVKKYKNLPHVILQLTLQHNSEFQRKEFCIFMRQILDEKNVIKCFSGSLKASERIHDDDARIPNAVAPVDIHVESLRNDCFVYILEAFSAIVQDNANALTSVAVLFKEFTLQILA